MSSYLKAVTLRAVRFLPRLEMAGWQKLTEFMFVGEDVTRLLATETWLALTVNMDMSPLADDVRKQAQSILNKQLPDRRLLKNYLLVLGKVNAQDVVVFASQCRNDPLLSQACSVASNGAVADLFLTAEPEIIRQKYYSTKYRHFDDGSEGSI